MERITWDQYFMVQSHIIAMRSTCTRLAVGATIVRDKRIIAAGYNGSISGDDHCIDVGCYMENNHCIRTIHAEVNAILQCAKYGISTNGADLYVTHFPCLACTKSIIQAGIKRVYYSTDYHNHPFAMELFKKANVHVEKVPFKKENVDFLRNEKLELALDMLESLRKQGASNDLIQQYEERVMKLFNGEGIS